MTATARHRSRPRRSSFIGSAVAAMVLLPTAIAGVAWADPWPSGPTGTAQARSVAAQSIQAAVTPSSSAAKIRGLQYLLTHNGFATDADGIYGPGTTSSVTSFQQSRGLTADGEAGPDTLGALIVRTEQGQSGDNVRAAQALLNDTGTSLAEDGEFGDGTAAAVRNFQSAQGLAADGIVGPDTWTALFNAGSSGGGGGGGGDCDAVTAGVPIEQTALATNDIRVNTCFLDLTNAMVAAAAADGVTLTANSSWRDPQEQIELRRQNCGTTDYDIYQKPADQCSPPTAIPGQSRHERGLAVDFANAGSGGAVWNWLQANASRFHYYNYPAENWHWSWDGG